MCATDTGDGKTHVACGMARALVARGLRVAVAKPIESGVDAIPADADALRRAAGLDESALPSICPWPLPRPVAPALELERLGIEVTDDDLRMAVARAAEDADVVLVETAGGVRSPLTATHTSVELARLLGGPVLLVVRERLGAISAAVCAAREIQRAGIGLLGVVVNRVDATAAHDSVDALQVARSIGRQLDGVELFAATTAEPAPAALVDRLAALVG